MWPEESATENMKRGLVGKGMAGGRSFKKRLKQTTASEPEVYRERRRAAIARGLKRADIGRPLLQKPI